MVKTSERTLNFKQSGIRAATAFCQKVGGVNLGQGISALPIADEIISAAHSVLDKSENCHRYGPCEGGSDLREVICKKINNTNKIDVSLDEVIVTHGSTGAFVCATMTLFNPGDEVILFEPFYGYHLHVLQLLGVSVKTSPLNLNDFSFDLEHLESIRTNKTKALVICNPCNPCGKVFSRAELVQLGEWAAKNDVFIITDEIYEYITYPGHEHISLASLADFKNNTLTISGLSKTYNMTGWRLGYASGPAHVIQKMATVQDFLYVCPARPLQEAAVAAFDLPQSYYEERKLIYLNKRDRLCHALQRIGFKVYEPQGAYYIMADFSELGFKDDDEALKLMLERSKVAAVTGRSFYLDPVDGQKLLRFCYAVSDENLDQAIKNLDNL